MLPSLLLLPIMWEAPPWICLRVLVLHTLSSYFQIIFSFLAGAYKRYAFGIISEYLSEDLSAILEQHLDLPPVVKASAADNDNEPPAKRRKTGDKVLEPTEDYSKDIKFQITKVVLRLVFLFVKIGLIFLIIPGKNTGVGQGKGASECCQRL